MLINGGVPATDCPVEGLFTTTAVAAEAGALLGSGSASSGLVR